MQDVWSKGWYEDEEVLELRRTAGLTEANPEEAKSRQTFEVENSDRNDTIIKQNEKYIPVATTEEADEYLRSLGIDGQYTKGQVNIDVANTVNKSITEFIDIFGSNIKIGGVREWPKRYADFVAAYSPASGDIFLYEVKAKNTIARLREDTIKQHDCGSWSTGEVEHFIRHELGHALHYNIGNRTNQEALQNIYNTATDVLEWGKHGFTLEDYTSAGLTEEKYLMDLKVAGEILSGYGFVSVEEMVAESVAEYMSGTPREFAMLVVNTLMGW